MSERLADPQVVCPFVAFDDDRDYRSPVPDHRHRCFAERPAAPRALAHQAAYCLAGAFPGCPTFVDWARREAAPPKPEASARSLRDAGGAPRSAGAAPGPGRTPGTASPAPAAGSPGGPVSSRPAAHDWAAPPPWGVPGGAPVASPSTGLPGEGVEPAAAGATSDEVGERPGGEPEAGERPSAEPEAVERPGAGERPAAIERPGAGERPAAIGRPGAGERLEPGERPEAGARPAFLAGRGRRRRSAPPDEEPWDDEGYVPDVDEEVAPPPARRPEVEARRMPVGYAPVAPGRGERRAGSSRRERVDPDAPSWEQPRRFESYPTIRSRGVALPRPAIYALVVVLVGAGLFAAPFLVRSLGGGGGGGESTPTPAPTSTAAATALASPTPVPTPEQVVYVVKSGDTLSKIAARYGVTIEQVLAANPEITNPNRIAAGDRIVIPQPLPTEIVDGAITPAP